MAVLRPKILVIDDQPGIRRLLHEVLTEEGYDVDTAANGYEGLDIIQAAVPALILMDMKMPGLDGIETLRELRRRGQGDKVIMMTAYGELDLINEAKAMGAGYITKPFDIIALCRRISEILGQSQNNDAKVDA